MALPPARKWGSDLRKGWSFALNLDVAKSLNLEVGGPLPPDPKVWSPTLTGVGLSRWK